MSHSSDQTTRMNLIIVSLRLNVAPLSRTKGLPIETRFVSYLDYNLRQYDACLAKYGANNYSTCITHKPYFFE